MIYAISNQNLQVKINSLGAELFSIKSAKTGIEYLWQGSPNVWTGRAPVLFPICGRLFEGKYTLNDKEYFMNTHGFARTSEFSLLSQTENEISLVLRHDENTLKAYPFEFEFIINFKLEQNKLIVSKEVKNLSDNVMPFSIGAHPGFNAPFNSGESMQDYYVEFLPKGNYHTARFTANGFDSGETFPLNIEDEKYFYIKDDIFITNDSVFVPSPPTSMTLKSKKSQNYVKVYAENMAYMGLWKPVGNGANLICIEPWLGFPEKEGKVCDFMTKNHMIKLGAKESFNTEYYIEIGEK